MATSKTDTRAASIRSADITDAALTVNLSDGRTISVPLTWYPRLVHGSAAERQNWRLIGNGEGMHWPDLDEDISVESILVGSRSAESGSSLQKWLEQRKQAK